MTSKLNPNHALVVLSGGQDSTTCLYWALLKYDAVYAISFDYGQRHSIELESARMVSDLAGLSHWGTSTEADMAYPSTNAKNGFHEIIDVRGLLNSTSPLTSDTQLEEYANYDQMEAAVGTKIERTFVPMRNTLFLTIAANRAVELGCGVIVTGICGEDNANYPDCTDAFRRRSQVLFNESLFGDRYEEQPPQLLVSAPLMHLSKADTVRLAVTLPGCMEALAFSHTSYDGLYPPTGMNHSNILRAKGFETAGVPDPLVLRAWTEGLMELPETSNYDNARKGPERF